MRRVGAWLALVLVAVLVAGGLVAFSRPSPRPLSARQVELRFVRSAVWRRHLERSYELVTSAFRQGMSRSEWSTGTIPVVPSRGAVHLGPRLHGTRYRLVSVGRSYFWIELVRSSGRWLVNYWVPAAVYGAHT